MNPSPETGDLERSIGVRPRSGYFQAVVENCHGSLLDRLGLRIDQTSFQQTAIRETNVGDGGLVTGCSLPYRCMDRVGTDHHHHG